MSAPDSGLAQLDALLVGLLSGWDIYSTAIATAIVLYVGHSIFFSPDPDVHPALLARQAVEAPIRQPGESASFRARETPHGYALKSGLGIKDPGVPKWTFGRNGDLRDIWRAAVRGAYNEVTKAHKRGTIYKVIGNSVEEISLDDISLAINVMGRYIRDSGADTVAICLSDSVEFLAALFAGAFYGFKTVIIPHNLPSDVLAASLREAGASLLIAEAGAVELPLLREARTNVQTVIWVARAGSEHMDWSEQPREIGGKIKVSDWNQLVKENPHNLGPELPASDADTPLYPLKTLWSDNSGAGTFVEYTQENLVAGVAALGASLPRGVHLTSADVLLSTDSLARSYPLCLTLAALYVNASVALNSVGGEVVDFGLATIGASPTLIVASSHTISDYHTRHIAPEMGPLSKLGRFFQRRALYSGVMPKRSRLLPPKPPQFDHLRLLFISHRADGDTRNLLTYEQLTDLRIFTGARVLYALTAAKVAGALFQTLAYDYRRYSGPSHFGPPLSSVEIKLVGHQENAGASAREGKILCSGPAVIGGSCTLEATGRFREDNTFILSAWEGLEDPLWL